MGGNCFLKPVPCIKPLRGILRWQMKTSVKRQLGQSGERPTFRHTIYTEMNLYKIDHLFSLSGFAEPVIGPVLLAHPRYWISQPQQRLRIAARKRRNGR